MSPPLKQSEQAVIAVKSIGYAIYSRLTVIYSMNISAAPPRRSSIPFRCMELL